MHVYEVRLRKDHRGFDLIFDALSFGRMWHGELDAANNAVDYAKFYSRSYHAVIRVYSRLRRAAVLPLPYCKEAQSSQS